MSVKNFKFVSPGVFINEIDNSFIPRSAGAIGPVVVGRSQRGLAMQPTKVESFSEFVELFGDTVPGKAGGDISRDGNLQSPMYGTYAAKAFLVSNVAPLTYIRVLGEQKNSSDNTAGWKTANNPATSIESNGGAYGLWVWPSASFDSASGLLGTGSLAAVWYLNSGSSIQLSGTLWGSGALDSTEGIGKVIRNEDNLFTVRISGSSPAYDEKISFGFADANETFMRKVFNTNPQLASAAGTFYASDSFKPYWLGETFELLLPQSSSVGEYAVVSLKVATDEPQEVEQDENAQNDILIKTDDWKFEERLSKEFEAVGFFISDHPLNQFTEIFNDYKITDYSSFISKEDLKDANIAATLLKVQERKTAKGNSYAVLKLTDLSSVFELFIFSDVLELNREILKEGSSLILTIFKNVSNDENRLTRINVQKIASLKDLFNSPINEVSFQLNSEEQIEKISTILNDEGKTIVNINLVTEDNILKFRLKNARKLERKSLNLLRNQEIQAIIN